MLPRAALLRIACFTHLQLQDGPAFWSCEAKTKSSDTLRSGFPVQRGEVISSLVIFSRGILISLSFLRVVLKMVMKHVANCSRTYNKKRSHC
jgi:hypothetical protein